MHRPPNKPVRARRTHVDRYAHLRRDPTELQLLALDYRAPGMTPVSGDAADSWMRLLRD